MATLVLGATGFVGSALVRELATTGDEVYAASRRPHPAPAADAWRWIECDLERSETLAPALEGIDCVYYLVHSMGKGGAGFRATERTCALALARAADAAGCRRIIYLGAVAPEGPPSEHLASRLDVGEILRAGRVPAIELRASMIIGNGSASWQILRDLANRLPFMVLPYWLESRTCPIALSDAITALRDARVIPLDASAWFDIPGLEVLRFREMIEIVAALSHRRIPAIRVPVVTPRLSAMWLRLVTRADYHLARELVLGLGHDLLPQSARYWDVTGHPPQLTFREAAAQALATEPPGTASARALERLVHHLGPRVPPGHAPSPPARSR